MNHDQEIFNKIDDNQLATTSSGIGGIFTSPKKKPQPIPSQLCLEEKKDVSYKNWILRIGCEYKTDKRLNWKTQAWLFLESVERNSDQTTSTTYIHLLRKYTLKISTTTQTQLIIISEKINLDEQHIRVTNYYFHKDAFYEISNTEGINLIKTMEKYENEGIQRNEGPCCRFDEVDCLRFFRRVLRESNVSQLHSDDTFPSVVPPTTSSSSRCLIL